ncbi:MAG: SIS domain-containing protein [Anaerolineales bacterium]|jgi:glucosamine--fructose-6-phosphate aminotransferase (isomerizing)
MQENNATDVQRYVEFIGQSWEQAHEQTAAIAASLQKPDGFILFGSGDSHHAARGLSMLLSQATNSMVRAIPAMKASRYLFPDFPHAGSRWIAVGFSVSGEVARTIEGIELAAAQGLHTIAVTANPRSTLASRASSVLSLDPPQLKIVPGLAGYAAALVLGAALGWAYAIPRFRATINRAMIELPAALNGWLLDQMSTAEAFAVEAARGATVILGSGPAYGSAMFGSAKLIELAGEYAWAQEVEEWCHLEYFCTGPDMPTILLSSSGRSVSREQEMRAAAAAIGRQLLISQWDGALGWPRVLREILSPFALWAAPAGFALRRSADLGQQPFRGFSGGRSQDEGGGASRIRSSRRLARDDFQSLA